MKTTKLTLTAVFSILLATAPAFAAEEGGNTGFNGSTSVTPGHPSISTDTPDCTDCLIRTVAKGDIGVSNGTYTEASAATKTPPASNGSSAGSNQ